MALIRHWHKYVIVTLFFLHIRTIYTKPISVPVVWPDSAGGSQNLNRNSYAQPNRRIEAINERPNSDFNRLVFNRIGHNLQNANSQGYVDYVDTPERLTNNFAVQGGSEQNDGKNKLVFDDTQSRTKFLFKKKLKKKKKKICLPVGYGHGKADSLRTLYDINVIFADVNVNEYDTVGGYGCKPLFGSNSGHGGGHGSHGGGHGSHGGGHGSHGGGHGSHGGDNGGHGSNHQTGSHHGSTNYGGSNHGIDETDSVVDSDHDYVDHNDHGSLIQTDDYDNESSEPSQSTHGSSNLFGGLFHGTTNNHNNNNYNNNNNNYQQGYASGGPLGFFGQGGLFDFSNNGQRPQSSGTLGDSIDDTVKPVIEINVPDTIQDVVQGNWRPGNLVGGIQNSVSGFIQDISNRPGQTLRQINREISSLFRSFTDLF